jgi:Tfp pilus assembly protein PilZ
MAGLAEHREAARVLVNLQVEVRRNGAPFSGTLVNCSLRGVFLRTPSNLQSGELIELRITLPNVINPIVIESRVIWTDWHEPKEIQGYGIHFFSLSDEQADHIRTFLEGV